MDVIEFLNKNKIKGCKDLLDGMLDSFNYSNMDSTNIAMNFIELVKMLEDGDYLKRKIAVESIKGYKGNIKFNYRI